MAPIHFSARLKEYILSSHEAYARMDPLATKGLVRVTTMLVDNCRSEGTLEGHTVVCDEPPERGGTAQGPAPLSYFLASLGY